MIETRSKRRRFIAALISVPLGLLVAAVLLPPKGTRCGSPMRQCQENLTRIDGAKEQWAMDSSKITGPQVTAEDLISPELLKEIPKCPSGGVYIINDVGTGPVCTSGLPGHSLSEVGDAITEIE